MIDVSLRQKAYDYIQGKLLTGELRGGSLISEHSLAAEINISRTPVREAVHQLEIEGLLEKRPRYGTIVRVPNRDEIAELFDLREALETYAAAQSAARLLPAERQMLELLVEEMHMTARGFEQSGRDFLDERMLRRFLTADMGFHMTLIRSVNNRRLMKTFTDLRVVQRIFGSHRMPHGPSIVEEACRHHQDILEAVRAGDSEAAGHAAARHIRASKEHSLEGLEAQESRREGADWDLPALPADLRRDIERLPSLSGLGAIG